MKFAAMNLHCVISKKKMDKKCKLMHRIRGHKCSLSLTGKMKYCYRLISIWNHAIKSMFNRQKKSVSVSFLSVFLFN